MKYHLWLIIIFFSACTNTLYEQDNELSDEIVDVAAAKTNLRYQKVGKRYLDTLSNRICSATQLEFIDLYPLQDSIAEQDYLYLATFLRSRGFEVLSGGRGNWMEGPRVVSLRMENETCHCEIMKMYYTKDENGQYKVTERLDCRSME